MATFHIEAASRLDPPRGDKHGVWGTGAKVEEHHIQKDLGKRPAVVTAGVLARVAVTLACVRACSAADSGLPQLMWLDGVDIGDGHTGSTDDPCKLDATTQQRPARESYNESSLSLAPARNITFGFAFDYDKMRVWHVSPANQSIETKAFAHGLCRWVKSAAQFGDVVLVHNRKHGERMLLHRLQRLAPDRLTLAYVDPYSDSRYRNKIIVANGSGAHVKPQHSPHNLRFFVLNDLLASGRFMCNYCLITDVTDVVALADPFAAMAGDGMATPWGGGRADETTLFIGDERGWPGVASWLHRQMQSCFSIDFPAQMYPKDHILNCGLIGAAGSAFYESIDSVTRLLDIARSSVCDMAVVNLIGLVTLHGKPALLRALQRSEPVADNTRANRMRKAIVAVRAAATAHGPPFNCPFRMIGLPLRAGDCAMAHKQCRYTSCGRYGTTVNMSKIQ
eukprot:m.206658 g.206658  ORF g.206658 m.206658 type:complete len:450 (+) comp25361_c0_seq1:1221-2570(+)